MEVIASLPWICPTTLQAVNDLEEPSNAHVGVIFRGPAHICAIRRDQTEIRAQKNQSQVGWRAARSLQVLGEGEIETEFHLMLVWEVHL